MGEPAEVSAADRAVIRQLCARIVQSVIDDTPMPLGLEDCHDRPRPLYHHSDVEDLVMSIAQEVTALQQERDLEEKQFQSAARLLAKAVYGGNITRTDTSLIDTLLKLAGVEP